MKITRDVPIPRGARAAAGLSGAAVLALLVAGCGGTATIDRGKLEKEVQSRLSATVGKQAPPASCPGTLEAKVGATTRCSMTFKDGKLGITVRVDSVKHGVAHFNIVADKKVQPLSG